jgi:hypothetical protein
MSPAARMERSEIRRGIPAFRFAPSATDELIE